MDHIPELPIRPRLSPGIEVVPVDQDKILLRSFSGTVMLSGEFVATVLPALLHQLDGSKTTQDLWECVSENFRPEFEEFLILMMEKKILFEADSIGIDRGNGPPTKLNSYEKAYWSLDQHVAADALNRLQSSTVILVNL